VLVNGGEEIRNKKEERREQSRAVVGRSCAVTAS
jgi:hypothetical protein